MTGATSSRRTSPPGGSGERARDVSRAVTAARLVAAVRRCEDAADALRQERLRRRSAVRAAAACHTVTELARLLDREGSPTTRQQLYRWAGGDRGRK